MNTKTAENENFEMELKATELGDFILKNKTIIFGIVALVVVAIIGAGINNYFNEKAEQEASGVFYSFELNEFKAFQDGKLDTFGMLTKFNAIASAHNAAKTYMTNALMVSDALIAKGNYTEAMALLEKIKISNNFQKYLTLSRLALCYEMTNKTDEALKALNDIVATGLKVNEGKIYIDLGRLYLQKNDKDMAKKSFDYVKTINTESVFKSLADHYLSTL